MITSGSSRGLAYFNLSCAVDLVNEGGGRKLTIGEKIFVLQSTKVVAEIPYSMRPKSIDSMLLDLISVGVLDFRFKERGVDGVFDFFYDNPYEYDASAFANM